MSFATWPTFAGKTRSRTGSFSFSMPRLSLSTFSIATGPVELGASVPDTRTPSFAIVE